MTITADDFLNEKPAMALVTVKNANESVIVSEVAKNIDTTYAHTVKIITKLEDNGLVKSEKKGREKHLYTTDKGTEYAELFEKLFELINPALIKRDLLRNDLIDHAIGAKK